VHENEISEEIIGAAIEVHKELGPGLLESVYEEALVIEMGMRGLQVTRQQEVPIAYKGIPLKNVLRLDLMVDGVIVVEVKSVERILSVHEAQLLSYLRLAQKRLGLLINFNSTILSRSVRRVVNRL
jgi:GxxExxY protein